MSRLVEGLVKSGQHNNHIKPIFLMWESITIAETRMGDLAESGVTPLIQIRNGSIAMSKGVLHQTTVRKVIHWVPAIREG